MSEPSNTDTALVTNEHWKTFDWEEVEKNVSEKAAALGLKLKALREELEHVDLEKSSKKRKKGTDHPADWTRDSYLEAVRSVAADFQEVALEMAKKSADALNRPAPDPAANAEVSSRMRHAEKEAADKRVANWRDIATREADRQKLTGSEREQFVASTLAKKEKAWDEKIADDANEMVAKRNELRKQLLEAELAVEKSINLETNQNARATEFEIQASVAEKRKQVQVANEQLESAQQRTRAATSDVRAAVSQLEAAQNRNAQVEAEETVQSRHAPATSEPAEPTETEDDGRNYMTVTQRAVYLAKKAREKRDNKDTTPKSAPKKSKKESKKKAEEAPKEVEEFTEVTDDHGVIWKHFASGKPNEFKNSYQKRKFEAANKDKLIEEYEETFGERIADGEYWTAPSKDEFLTQEHKEKDEEIAQLKAALQKNRSIAINISAGSGKKRKHADEDEEVQEEESVADSDDEVQECEDDSPEQTLSEEDQNHNKNVVFKAYMCRRVKKKLNDAANTFLSMNESDKTGKMMLDILRTAEAETELYMTSDTFNHEKYGIRIGS